jgi:hypothetical protein
MNIDWLQVATIIGILSTTITASMALIEFRLKLQAEKRLADSATAEKDVLLLESFTDILYVASGRRGDAIFSKEILELLVKKGGITDADIQSPDQLKEKVSKAAMLAQVPGAESKDAAYAAIAALAMKHEVLYLPAVQALETMRAWSGEISTKYLKMIAENRSSSSQSNG